MGRPEGNEAGGYDAIGPVDDVDVSALWRPSQRTAAGRSPAPGPTARDREAGGFQWTEPQPERFGEGHRVRATRPVGGLLGSAVPAGTIGHVESTRAGLTDTRVTVRFDNGLTDEVRPGDITHQGWF